MCMTKHLHSVLGVLFHFGGLERLFLYLLFFFTVLLVGMGS